MSRPVPAAATPTATLAATPTSPPAVPGLTVLVTGAGGPAGISVIRALRPMGHRIVAADASPHATGLRLADAAGVLPDGGTAELVPALLDLCRHHGVDAVIPTVAEELVALGRHGDALRRAGIAHWVPAPDSVERCTDKWLFHATASEAGIRVPPTALGGCAGVEPPWVVKPRFGRGSRDIVLVDRAGDLAAAVDRVPDALVQHRLIGREFTVDALAGDGGRVLHGAVPRWRDETKAGISVRGQTFSDPVLVDDVGRLLAALGLEGPANVQGFVAEPGERATFTEVNPRFSGGLPLSLAAGSDLVGQYLAGMTGRPVDAGALRYRSGVRMYRYYQEIFEEGDPA